MITFSVSHIPYAELPSQARSLFFIFALAAVARYGTQPPKQSELTPILEVIWNKNQLRLKDLRDPSRITVLLKTELAPVSLAGYVQ
jgi:hypothetical protein